MCCEKMEENCMRELPQAIKEPIRKIIEKQNFISYNVKTNKLSSDNNFLGELYEIDIIGETGKGNKQLHIFAKLIIKNEDFKIYSIPEVYEKEVFVYLELSKIFDKVQNDANISTYDRLNIAASFEETNPKCIILENLTKQGYKIMPKMETMTLEFAEKSITELAKFHALSFVLEARNPNYFDTKIKNIKQSFIYDTPWYDLVDKMYDISVSKFDKDTKHKLDRFYQLSSDKYPKYMNGQTSTLKCLCHGDFKMNNVMYKEENGHTHVVPIDFQQIYYGCPIIDLIYFLYAASDGTFRRNHLHTLKDHYYAAISGFLKNFNIEFHSICSKVDFDQSFQNSLEYALMFTIYMLPAFYAVDMPTAKDNIMELSLSVDDRFHVRIKEIVDEFIDMKII